jgi:hypothetical protein
MRWTASLVVGGALLLIGMAGRVAVDADQSSGRSPRIYAPQLPTVTASVVRSDTGSDRSGFRTLALSDAQAFVVPADMRRVAQSVTGDATQPLMATSYRQFVGIAEVIGGEITVYGDAEGRQRAVVGSHYPRLRPANTIRLTLQTARLVAAEQRAIADGAWTTQLMMHPETSRYVYRVEVTSRTAAWTYWVDADSGELIGEAEGPADRPARLS